MTIAVWHDKYQYRLRLFVAWSVIHRHPKDADVVGGDSPCNDAIEACNQSPEQLEIVGRIERYKAVKERRTGKPEGGTSNE